MNNQKIKEVIRQILINILESHVDEIRDDDDLFEKGVLESLTLAIMIPALEEKFQIEIDPEEIVPEYFSTINSITSLVARRIIMGTKQ